MYLLEEGKQNYEMLSLTGGEFTFDVDLSKLPCGMNGAVYLSEMEKDGGKSKEPLNQAGATYGTGYCDAQCFTTPFINGVVSPPFMHDFTVPLFLAFLPLQSIPCIHHAYSVIPSRTSSNSPPLQANLDGSGSCCNEMDIWEANARSTGIAPHTCARPSLFKCRGTECEWSGLCDEWGCTYNPYKVGQPSFYGTGSNFKVDTRRPFTVVTQFPTDSAGNLIAYRRLYVQDGRVIQNAVINVQSGNVAQFNGQNEMNDAFCLATGGAERYLDLGGTKAMGEALRRGMVLIFSLWWDETGYMQWMDGSATGTGPCNASEGDPRNIRNIEPNPMVTFSQVKWGEMGSTFRVNGKRSWRSDLE